MCKGLWRFSVVLILLLSSSVSAQIRTTAFQPEGIHVLVGAIEPALRKWYIPQELYSDFGWEQWRYTNYAKDIYRSYSDIGLEGYRYYDIYGQYITKGWKVYDWSQEMPKDFGSTVFKSPKFSSWFNNILISSTRKGQYYTALTAGNEIRATLTPLTFSKPTFNGIQLDFQSDKYAATVLTSRASHAGTVLAEDTSTPESSTSFTNFVGLRGVFQVGRFASIGATYVNAHIGQTLMDWADYSLKGQLSTSQNNNRVREITIRLSDDSPEDQVAGAMLFQESIFINGKKADIDPDIRGGILREGHWEANGEMELLLVYDISGWAYLDAQGNPVDFSSFEKITFKLVLANDYKVEITSNAQTDEKGEQIFLPIARALDNVKDATNQRQVVFDYGLPTANQIYGLTFELDDLAGFSIRAEYDINTRYRRFPNPNPDIRDHSLASDKSNAWYVTMQKLSDPWYAYVEAFSMDPDYSTTMYLTGTLGEVYYNNSARYWFEFVDDNDDQDRWPDWRRKGSNQMASGGSDEERGVDQIAGGVFPGLDENNDLVPDFNQNWNFWPDYEEPFLRHTVDPPEYLFGVDMNNNAVIDRFENDQEPDYPFKRDRRGYNAYLGVEAMPGVKLTAGHLNEWTLSSDRRSEASYLLFTLQRSFPGVGLLRLFDNFKIVRDDIPDDLIQWEQLPGMRAGMVQVNDPLICEQTRVNSAYADFEYTGIDHFSFVTKLKYDTYNKLQSRLNKGLLQYTMGYIGKASYNISPARGIAIEPRMKIMLLRKRPFRQREEKDFWFFPSLISQVPVFEYGLLESGVEYTIYRDLADRLDTEDFHNLVFAFQFSNVSSYMGYKITSKVGFRQSTQYFKREVANVRRTSNTIFVQLYAGVE